MTEQTSPQLAEKVAIAIETLRVFEPKDAPYYGCFSGGKDSVVIKELGRLAGLEIDWHYNVTTIDAPELVTYIRTHHPDVSFVRPKKGPFMRRISERGLPTRQFRWCCEEFKEHAIPEGRRVILGVRHAESPRRKATWKVATFHKRAQNFAISPILFWTDDDVWEFIHQRGLPYCSLYDEGFKRLGCIACPMAGATQRKRDLARWPKYREQYLRAITRLWNRKKGAINRNGEEWFGSRHFSSPQQLFDWWLSDLSAEKYAEECQGFIEGLV